MNLRVLRTEFTSKSTCGELWIEEKPYCFTLEEPTKDGQHGSAILAGTYKLIIDWSDRFGRAMPRLVNVPYREGILIHWGNEPSDTEGCILVGDTHITGSDWISNSRQTFNKLFTALSQGGDMSIEIVGGQLL